MIPKHIPLIEFILLCIAFPSLIIALKLGPFMLIFLWSAFAYCYLTHKKIFNSNFKEIWDWSQVKSEHLKPILIRWALSCAIMVAFVYFYTPEHLFEIIKQRPYALPFIAIFYSILSALPQEFIFCTFFFDRYDGIFKSNRAKIIASALVFAYAHMLYINWIAPTFSLAAGLIFAQTYIKHRSLALVTIEHALYGNAMFIIGLGSYFFSCLLYTSPSPRD